MQIKVRIVLSTIFFSFPFSFSYFIFIIFVYFQFNTKKKKKKKKQLPVKGAFHMQGVTPRPWPYAAQLQSYLPYRLGGLALRSYTLHSPVIHFATFEENLHNLNIIQSSFDVICSGFFQSVPDRERPLRLAIDNEYQLLLNLKAKSSSPLASEKREGVPIRRRQQLYCHLMDLYAVYPSLTGLFTNDVRDPSKSNPILRANLIRIIATQKPAACGFL